MANKSDVINVVLSGISTSVVNIADFSSVALLVPQTKMPTKDAGESTFKIIKINKEEMIGTNIDGYDDVDLTLYSIMEQMFQQSFLNYGVNDIVLLSIKEDDISKVSESLEEAETLMPNSFFVCTLEDILFPSIDDGSGGEISFELTDVDLESIDNWCRDNYRGFIYFFKKNSFAELEPTINSIIDKGIGTNIFIGNHFIKSEYVSSSVAAKIVLGFPGSSNAKFKNVLGITGKAYSQVERNNYDNIGVNLYFKENSDISFLRTGKMLKSSQIWWDFFFGLEYYRALLKNDLANFLEQPREPSLSFNQNSFAMISSRILRTSSQFITKGFFAEDSVNVSFPSIASIPSDDFNNRILSQVVINVGLLNKINFIDAFISEQIV